MRLMQDLVDETLSGRYRLITRIAGGGMGEVYRGHDLLLDRIVAVKVLQASLAADPQFVHRFRSEARSAARLAHPNVVAVHDWGCEDERTYYMVMEYVAGSDLRDLLVARGSLQPAQATEIMIGVCDALGAAHRTGLVHRDVKPENVLVAPDGKVKVADFGIAAAANADRARGTGPVLGTLRYLAPEQARGLDATPASDIWAAGAVLSELLTGRPPLQGAGADLLRRRALEIPIGPAVFDASIPQDLNDVVIKACALDPRDRFAEASDMAGALRRIAVRSLPDAAPIASLVSDVTGGEVPTPDMEATVYIGRSTKRRAGRRRKLARWAVAALATATLAVGGAKAAEIILPQDVEVPRVVGLSRGEAREAAAAHNLEIDVVERVRDEDVPAGHVISQQPEDGTLQEGSSIELVVSAGPPPVDVPDVVGLSRRDAEILLSRRSLEVGRVASQYSMKPKGHVIEQSPAQGRLLPGEQVRLTVSKGPEPLEVPAVAGADAAAGEKRLRSAGFVVVVVSAFSDDVAKGDVISTDPLAGAIALKGSTIEMVVSKGPEFEEVTMPDVRNMSVGAARRRLEALGLKVDVRRSGGACAHGSTVVETDPLAGTKIRENDLVALFVC